MTLNRIEWKSRTHISDSDRCVKAQIMMIIMVIGLDRGLLFSLLFNLKSVMTIVSETSASSVFGSFNVATTRLREGGRALHSATMYKTNL